MKCRNYVFTVNIPEELALDAPLLPVDEWPSVKGVIYSLERGEDGTLHYQGYMELTSPQRTAYICENFLLWDTTYWGAQGVSTHVDKRRGTRDEAIDYARKTEDDTFVDGPWYWPDAAYFAPNGNRRGQGRRNDLETALALVKDRKTNAELIDLVGVVAVKYHRGLEWARTNMVQPKRSPASPKDCIIYWGPTGTGKSHRLAVECPEGPEWYWCSPGKWFDGYQGQPGLVFDEIRDSWYAWEYLLKLIDLYPLQVETKGGVVNMVATVFRMSTNVHPKFWYSKMATAPNRPWRQSPLRRRFSAIRLMAEPYEGGMDMDVEDLDEPDENPGLVPDAVGVLWDGERRLVLEGHEEHENNEERDPLVRREF